MPRTHRVVVGASIAAASLLLAVVPLAAGAGATPATAARASRVAEDPICPSDTANGRFVRWIYLNILNRCPDASGAAHWTAKLDSGTDRWAFARQVDYSNENITKN